MQQDKLKTLSQDWGRYWQGRTGKASANALVGIEKNPEISTFWRNNLSGFPKNPAVLDMACGAGTVAKILKSLEFENVSGLDISADAISVMSSELPTVHGFVGPLEKMSFQDEQFSLIVSQYGFEYGQYEQVIPEVVRILEPGGRFLSLSHKADGAIHEEVCFKYDQMVALRDINYIEPTRELFISSMGGSSERAAEAVLADFVAKRKALEALAKTQGGLAGHLLNGSATMYERRQNFHLDDVLKWLDEMRQEIESFVGRMGSMKSAAIDEHKLKIIVDQFSSMGVEMETSTILKDSRNKELGWIIAGQKKHTG